MQEPMQQPAPRKTINIGYLIAIIIPIIIAVILAVVFWPSSGNGGPVTPTPTPTVSPTPTPTPIPCIPKWQIEMFPLMFPKSATLQLPPAI